MKKKTLQLSPDSSIFLILENYEKKKHFSYFQTSPELKKT